MTTTGDYTGLPTILGPNEIPVPFSSGNIPAMTEYGDNGADYFITKKLNAHRWAQGTWAIVEFIWPIWSSSYCDDPQGINLFWHAYNNEYLSTTQLNQYLTNYKNKLNWYEGQATMMGQHLHSVIVESHNGWTECSPPPCFPCPSNSTIYCWHWMLLYHCTITIAPIP